MLPSHLFVEIVDYSTRNYHVICREINKTITSIENSIYWCQQYQQPFNTVIPANKIPDAPTWKEEYCRVLKYKHVLHKITNSIEVDISFENLTILPLELKNMKRLITLYCHVNSLIEIPDTLTRLTKLYCAVNLIKKIPDTLTRLIELNCHTNQITELPNTLTQLIKLCCSRNKLKKIPYQLIKLTRLNCFKNKLTEVPDTLTRLAILQCDDNVLIPQNIREQLV